MDARLLHTPPTPAPEYELILAMDKQEHSDLIAVLQYAQRHLVSSIEIAPRKMRLISDLLLILERHP